MPDLITAKALAERLGVKPRTIREWARSGRIPCVRITSKVVRYEWGAVIRRLTSEAK